MNRKRLLDLFPGEPNKEIIVALGRFDLIGDTLFWFLSAYRGLGFDLVRLLAFPLDRAAVGMAFIVAIWDWHMEGSYAAAPPVIHGICRLIDKGRVSPAELLAYLRREGEAGARLIGAMGKTIDLPPLGFIESSLADHFLSHGDELGMSDAKSYEEAAVAVAVNPLATTILANRSDGGARKYHFLEVREETLFVAVNSDNRVITFFRLRGGVEEVLRSRKDSLKRPIFLKNIP